MCKEENIIFSVIVDRFENWFCLQYGLLRDTMLYVLSCEPAKRVFVFNIHSCDVIFRLQIIPLKQVLRAVFNWNREGIFASFLSNVEGKYAIFCDEQHQQQCFSVHALIFNHERMIACYILIFDVLVLLQ